MSSLLFPVFRFQTESPQLYRGDIMPSLNFNKGLRIHQGSGEINWPQDSCPELVCAYPQSTNN